MPRSSLLLFVALPAAAQIKLPKWVPAPAKVVAITQQVQQWGPLRLKAQQGDPEAMAEWGAQLLRGLPESAAPDLPDHLAEGRAMLHKAIAKGSGWAAAEWALWARAHGDQVAPEEVRGAEAALRERLAPLWKAMEAGNAADPPQALVLGRMFEAGLVFPRSATEAESWFRRAHDKGSPEGTRRLGLLLEARGKAARAPELIRQAAALLDQAVKASDPEALYQKAKALDASRAQAAQARALFQQAGDTGHPLALHYLGWYLEQGLGGPKNTEEARKAYLRGAKRGVAIAYYQAGMLLLGGTPEEATEAFKWLQRAAHTGDGAAQYQVGYMLREGLGTAKDPSAARVWLKKALDLGQPFAGELLGTMLEEGEGGAADLAGALEAYAVAASAGRGLAMYRIGVIHDTRPQWADPRLAVLWYQRAIEAKHFEGTCYRLGMSYLEGRGVPKDPARARDWFAMGAKACSGAEADRCARMADSLSEPRRKAEREKHQAAQTQSN